MHSIRDRATRSKTETWSRRDIETLFGVGRATAQSLTKAIGEVQNVAGAHFVERASLLSFLNEIIAADSVGAAIRGRLLGADAPPVTKPLRIALPPDLRNIMLRDLPDTIRLSPGRLEISAPDAIEMLESLALLAQALQNDLSSAQAVWDPAALAARTTNHDLLTWLRHDGRLS